MQENLIDQYLNIFGGFNFTWIIVAAIVFVVIMLVVSIIKYRMNVSIIKKSVKAAIRELIEEEKINITKQELKIQEDNESRVEDPNDN